MDSTPAQDKEQDPEQDKEQDPAQNQNQEKELIQLLRQFSADIHTTFPEYASIVQPWVELPETAPEWTTQMIPYLLTVYPPHFFNIVFKSDEFFTSETPILLFPQLDFRQLYNAPQVTEDIQTTIWEYIHAVLFKLMPFIEDKEQFQETADLFESVPEEELESRFAQVFENNPFMNKSAEEGEEVAPEEPETSRTTRMKQMLEKLMGSKLGQLSKTLMDELRPEMEEMFPELDLDSEENQSKVFQILMKSPSKLIALVKRAKTKMEEKMKRGEISKEELMEDMREMMKDADLKREMETIMKQMGGKGGLNHSAIKTEMSKTAQRNRMRMKRDAKKQKEFFQEEVFRVEGDANIEQSRRPMTEEELNALIREMEEPTPTRPQAKANKKKRK